MQKSQKDMVSVYGFFTIFVVILLSGSVLGQTMQEDLIKDMRWRSIGPANMSGRVSDIDALDDDYTTVLVGSASGGVWKSTNAGTTWEAIFSNYGSASIGDVAFFQKDPNIIWVGTGEECARNSIAWGDGIYKSTDGGATFTNMGLKDTHSIATVLPHPTDPDIVFAAAAGHLWGHSGERGVFKTTDGGETWQKLTNGLPDDGKTGAIDLIMNPDNPNELFVGMWERLRQPFRFDSGGPNGGIYKTTNGGRSWTKLTNGLPEGDTGKIGLAISRSNPSVVMAMVEHGFQPSSGGRGGNPPDPDYADMSKLGTGVYRSENGGRSWEFVNRYNNRPFYYSHIFINPLDDEKVYFVTGRFQISDDGGRTIRSGPGGIHGDYHTMWLDPNNENRYYIGNDGGAALTHDHNRYIFFDNIPPLAQFYAAGVDMRDPYYVYGGLQDNGTWGGPSRSKDSRGILTDHWFSIGGGDGFHVQVDPTDWRTVYVESQQGRISRRNAETRSSTTIRPSRQNIVNYQEYISEEIENTNEEKGWNNAFRFNWSSPIVMSPHNPRTIFFGGNFLFKSVNRGDNWQIISPDLSKNDPEMTRRESGGLTRDVTGAENHGSIITISESPVTPGLIWVGTDDGNVQITRNGGVSWTNIRRNVPGVPQNLWVSRVEASHFEEGTAYLTFDGHRSDNFQPWVFKSTDFGQTWTNITNNIPDGQVIYVIKEDLKNSNLLFIGTEFATFYSLNGGNSWTKLNRNMPTVAVHDLVIHPRDGDLIAATHGRGIWIMDDITPLQQATEEVLNADSHLFESRVTTRWVNISRGGSRGHLLFQGENPSNDAFISYYLRSPSQVTLEIADISGENTFSRTFSGQRGISKYAWNMRFDPNPEQVQQFVSNLRNRISQALPQASGDQRSRIQQLQNDLRGAGTDLNRLRTLADQIGQALGGGGRGGRGGGGGGLNGQIAQPGTYVVKMTVNGQTHTETLTIRRDPILDGGN